MSFDAFEARLHFLQLLRRLNASQQSIQAVVSYAVKYGRKCGEDLWECIMEESAKGSLNARINIFYMLDTLCDPITSANSLPPPTVTGSGASSSQTSELPYAGFLEKDLETLVGFVVPEGKEGMLNLLSAKQVIQSLRQKRAIQVELCDRILNALEERRTHPSAITAPTTTTASSRKRTAPVSTEFSRSDTLKRMEEDRERHKRLREKMWVIPLPFPTGRTAAGGSNVSGKGSTPQMTPSPATPISPSANTTRPPIESNAAVGTRAFFQEAAASAMEEDFERLWDMVGELEEDDVIELKMADMRCREQKRMPI